MNPQPIKATMSSRKRFKETMGYGKPDRVPYFEEGIRKDVLRAWWTQGLARETNLEALFPMAIIDTIMSTPVDVNALVADDAQLDRQLDGAFSNLVNYASKHWSYTASSRSGGDAAPGCRRSHRRRRSIQDRIHGTATRHAVARASSASRAGTPRSASTA